MKSLFVVACIAAAVAVTVSSQSPSADQTKLQAAQQEGKVVLYLQAPGPKAPIQIAFEKKYPTIVVERVTGEGSGPQITNQFLAEYVKGVKGADVVTLAGAALFDILETQPEALAKYTPAGTDWLSPDLRDKDARWASHTTGLNGIGYNTKLVSTADAPKNYRDLLDPRWRGKIGTGDPKAATSSASLWKTMETLLGHESMKRLAAQNIKFYANTGEAGTKLVAGEIAIQLNVPLGNIETSKRSGNPVEWVRMSDNVYLSQRGWYGISSNAPHPNAARVFVDFIFSKEGQQILADGGAFATMPGLRLSNPDLDIKGKKLIELERVTNADREAFLTSFAAKYNLSFP